MRLVNFQEMNNRHFDPECRKSKHWWKRRVSEGVYKGHITLNDVDVCEDYFLSHYDFDKLQSIDTMPNLLD